MAEATRTLNPLPFQDLEPHRFEDLVRQLIYDFRNWQKLEATGRSGGDEGFDARAVEALAREDEPEDEQSSEDSRTWLIQCKRERAIGPKLICEHLAGLETAGVYGLVFAAACDFSKKTRDAFYAAVREKGLSEAHLWGRGELEDQLFQPKNDHLLFAYFGISLTLRRRSIKTALRARLATKRRLHKLFEGSSHNYVLVRDAEDTTYPHSGDTPDFEKRPVWKVRRVAAVNHDGLSLVVRRHLAWLGAGDEWDAATSIDDEARPHEDPWAPRTSDEDVALRQEIYDAWQAFPDSERAWFELLGTVPFDDIVAIDDLGDEIAQMPHVYVARKNGAFALRYTANVQAARLYDDRSFRPRNGKDRRVVKFLAKFRRQDKPDPSSPII